MEGNYNNRQDLYTKVCKKYNYQCGICSQPLNQDGEITELHRIKPGLQGGKYTYNNVIPVHKFCHQKLHSSQRRKSKHRNKLKHEVFWSGTSVGRTQLPRVTPYIRFPKKYTLNDP
jgi:hypothetical protein